MIMNQIYLMLFQMTKRPKPLKNAHTQLRIDSKQYDDC